MAGMIHSLTLLVIILVAAPLAMNVPLCALSAILLFMAFNMGNWHEFVRLRQFTMSYKATLLVTFFLTVIFDLTVAVEIGLLTAALFFLYRMNTLTRVIPKNASPSTHRSRLKPGQWKVRFSSVPFPNWKSSPIRSISPHPMHRMS